MKRVRPSSCRSTYCLDGFSVALVIVVVCLLFFLYFDLVLAVGAVGLSRHHLTRDEWRLSKSRENAHKLTQAKVKKKEYHLEREKKREKERESQKEAGAVRDN